jgi:Putative zinc-finger
MNDHDCHDSAQLIPELALGCLDGRERAEALHHIRQCPRCRQELAAYQGLAGELLELVPAAPAPAGFEIRALAGMRTPPPGTGQAARGRRCGPLRAAVAAVLIAVAGAGGYQLSRVVTPPPPLHTAVLTAEGRQVGTAYLYSGSSRWIWVHVQLGPKIRAVTCKLEHLPGRRAVTIGTFRLAPGQNSWGSGIAVPWQPGTIALVVSSGRRAVATGTFR